MKQLLLYIGLLCCVAMQGQTLEILPETEGVHLVLPSWKNLRTLLQMDEDRQAASAALGNLQQAQGRYDAENQRLLNQSY